MLQVELEQLQHMNHNNQAQPTRAAPTWPTTIKPRFELHFGHEAMKIKK
jgi:hypothetical protein